MTRRPRTRPARRPRPEALEARALLAAFVVTSVADSGAGTLRDAITRADADASSGVDPITFDLPGPGVKVFALVSPLPAVTRSVTIDGTSQPGYVASSGPLIEIDGKGLPAGSTGLVIFAAQTTVEGLAIGDFSTGLRLDPATGATEVGDLVAGDYLGVAPDGIAAIPNQDGIVVDSGPSTIGGTTPAARDVISGNLDFGIGYTQAAGGFVIEGNFIGTDAAGKDGKIGNGTGIGQSGYQQFGGDAGHATIGGTVAGAGNVISGNTKAGIGGQLDQSLIGGNLVGLDVTGTKALGNGTGILLSAYGDTIGGTTAAARNVVSGNVIPATGSTPASGTGISVLQGDDNLIEGNYVGPDVTGRATVAALTGTGNVVGIYADGRNDTIGGTAAGAANVISGNSGAGVEIQGFGESSGLGELVEGNLIGTDATGSAPLGNGGPGIETIKGDNPPATTIGGTAAGAGNTIADNLGQGISVQVGQPGDENLVTIRGNSIFGNLAGGVSATTSSTVFTSEAVTGGMVTFAGEVVGAPGTAEVVDVYANPADGPAGSGEGQDFLGTVTTTIDGGGFGHFSGSLAAPSFASPVLSALTTGPDGETTDFSPDFPTPVGTASDDLSIAASVSPASILADGDATFTFTVTNHGTTAASEPTVTVAVPAGLTSPLAFSAGVAGANAAGNSAGVVDTLAGGVFSARLDGLAPGQSVALTVVATVTASGPVGLTAGVFDPGRTDPDLSNNEATATVTPTPPTASTPAADLSIAGLALPSPTDAYQAADFKLTVTNTGPGAATDVIVRDTETGGPRAAGASIALGSITPSQGSVASISGTGDNESYYVVDLGTIPAGGSATVVIASTAFQGGSPVVNVAKVTADPYDPTPADNTVVESIEVNAIDFDPTKLAISQAASPAAPVVGSPLTFTIPVSPTGAGSADGLRIVDTLPPGVTFDSDSSAAGPGYYDPSTRTVTFGDDPAYYGAEPSLFITVTPTAVGPLTNAVKIVGNDLTTPLASNSATVTVGPAITPASKQAPGDFDGDGESDLAVYLPALGEFAYRPSSGGPDVLVPFGFAGAGQTIPAVGDYTGAGHAEIAAYLPSIGSFAIRPASGPDEIVPFGFAGQGQTIPAPADYSGTGVDDIAAYLPSIGSFAIRPPSGPDEIVPFGFAGQGQTIPVPADYSGTGVADVAAYLPSIGAFAIRPAGGGPDEIIPFGLAGAGMSIPVPGDYDGSGKAELAVYLPSLGLFAYRPADGGPDVIEPFGPAGNGSVPVVGDYDGSGRDDLAIFDPTTAVFADRPTSGADVLTPFGAAGVDGSLPVLAPASSLIAAGATASAASVRFLPNPTAATAPPTLSLAVPRGPSASMRILALSRVAQSAGSASTAPLLP